MLKFFLENSPYSMMRLISFSAVGVGIIVVIIAVISCFTGLNHDYIGQLVNLCIIVLGFGFGGKLTQKIVEKEGEKVKS
jgi:predicted Na+-dependent transporter